jgi:kynurenine formamidase
MMTKNKKHKMIMLGSSRFNVINLTEPLKEDVEIFPGDPRPKKKVFSEISKTGYQHHIYSVGDHVFHPHGDAPKHQNPALQEQGFECFGIDYCFNQACLIDLSEVADAQEFEGIRYLTEIRKAHLEPYSRMIEGKTAVVIRTGYDIWLEKNKKHCPENIPYLTEEAGEFIAGFRDLRVIGTDSLTVDAMGSHSVHKNFKDRLVVESLVNLHGIPEGAKSGFLLQTSPVAIVGATGGPIVAYAFIEEMEGN